MAPLLGPQPGHCVGSLDKQLQPPVAWVQYTSARPTPHAPGPASFRAAGQLQLLLALALLLAAPFDDVHAAANNANATPRETPLCMIANIDEPPRGATTRAKSAATVARALAFNARRTGGVSWLWRP